MRPTRNADLDEKNDKITQQIFLTYRRACSRDRERERAGGAEREGENVTANENMLINTSDPRDTGM